MVLLCHICCPQFKVSKIYVFSGVCVLNLHTPASADSFYYYWMLHMEWIIKVMQLVTNNDLGVHDDGNNIANWCQKRMVTLGTLHRLDKWSTCSIRREHANWIELNYASSVFCWLLLRNAAIGSSTWPMSKSVSNGWWDSTSCRMLVAVSPPESLSASAEISTTCTTSKYDKGQNRYHTHNTYYHYHH